MKLNHFSATDQERLDAANSMLKFRKPSTILKHALPSSLPYKPSTKASKSRGKEELSSDSEESVEKESQESLKAGSAKLQQSPKIRKKVERQQVKRVDLPYLKQNAQEASFLKRDEAHQKALRFKPDISELHRTLLSWDYQHDGQFPPKAQWQLHSVPDTFSDFKHYRAVFEPLLLMECWAQLLQSKDDPPEYYYCRLPPGHTTASRNNPAEAGLRCYLPPDTRDPGLDLWSQWEISKVFSLSTLHREYAALVAAQYYDFADRILRPYLALPVKVDAQDIKQMRDKHKVNEPQARAIVGALKSDGFVLIQGPPGTGKTSTICALISASLQTHAPSKRKNLEVRKVLLCAPSNAAIDEIVLRLKGRYPSLKVVRTGAPQSISLNVKEVSLDSLIEEKLGTEGQSKSREMTKEMVVARQEFQTVENLRQDKIQELQKLRDSGSLSDSLETGVKQLTIKMADTVRCRARDEILREADVICSTLSGTGHESLEQYEFEMIIIDEAAQAVELSSLIPLRYKCTSCVMVGDPQQLPPTVISTEASQYQYNQSLFVRLQKQRPDAVHLLSIQYRMHPDISRLPSRIFYDNQLQDGPSMDVKTAQPWHTHSKLGTYRFFNVKRGLEETSGCSIKNRTEAQVAVALFNCLRKDFSAVDFSSRVGIVSMYSAQIRELKIAFEQRFGRDILTQVDFRTVDGFQGQEKDVIILSCVRAGPGIVNIGHVNDIRRMNVAITRAKSSLFILGNAATLERSNETWKKIVADSRDRNILAEVDVSYFTAPSTITTAVTPPQKSKQTKNAMPLPLPLDLSTPKKLKAATLSGPPKLISSEHIPVDKSAAIPPNEGSYIPPDNQKGKRKLEELAETSNVKSMPPAPSTSNTQAPPLPRKRPKQGPSLFIPRNKNKRP
ncbi:AAA domain-containing protein [Lentinula guzmanii]|uniref:AAA domain-containing protein n=1 Tax=Lentinula guzmanii TaxID=2804957 RepID=A0AA38MZW4_9AGAR|nr:AAA domain-containing protein [Lentinula guzmanii]